MDGSQGSVAGCTYHFSDTHKHTQTHMSMMASNHLNYNHVKHHLRVTNICYWQHCLTLHHLAHTQEHPTYVASSMILLDDKLCRAYP